MISPRNLKSVQEWLATAGPDDKESFRRIFAGVHRPRDPRFLTAPLAPAATRPAAPGEPPRPRTAASRCASRSGSQDDNYAAAAAALAARIRDALPPAGIAGEAGDGLARLLSGGDPAGLTEPARVLEVGPHARMTTSGATVGCLLDTPQLWPHTATTTIVPAATRMREGAAGSAIST